MVSSPLKLTYLIPDGQYNFFSDLIEPLKEYRIQCRVNTGLEYADVILAGILPTDHRWIAPLSMLLHPNSISRSSKPKVVIWHWDLYSFTDYREDRWYRFLKLLPQADRIWSCTYEVARQLKETMNLDSDVVPAWVNEAEFGGSPEPEQQIRDEVLYATSGGGFGKRIDWMERACQILGLKASVLHGQGLPRTEYVDRVRRCRVYCMTAFEESNATIPAMEAGASGRPVVLTDLPGSREVFGDRWTGYFQPNDFDDLLTKLEAAYHDNDGASKDARDILIPRLLEGYGLERVAKLAARKLWEVAYAAY